MTRGRADWTDGTPRLVVDTCRACAAVSYLPRVSCPGCGGREIEPVVSEGVGRCVAVTSVASGAEGVAPSRLALVELDEGATVMTRFEGGVVPGEQVKIAFRDAGHGDGQLVPICQKER